MTIGTTANNPSPAIRPDRQDVLSEIAQKWNKFSKQDLTEIITNDQLVGET